MNNVHNKVVLQSIMNEIFKKISIYKKKGFAKSIIEFLFRKLLLDQVIKFILNTKFGRNSFYSKYPKNQLLIANTSEGINYIVNSLDKVIGGETFVKRKSFDSQKLIIAKSICGNKKSLILDVGANIGTIGIFGISQGLFKKCISFEPDPHNFMLLQANVLINGLNKKFELNNVALSDKNINHLEFELSKDNFGDHRVKVKEKNGLYNEESRQVIRVKTSTIDSFFNGYDLSEAFLFMDTQGYEGHVLSGAKNLIEACVPIMTEFWPYGLKRSNGIEMFYEVLSNSDYNVLIDLSLPEKKHKFSIDLLRKIELELVGKDPRRYTDLMIYKEEEV